MARTTKCTTNPVLFYEFHIKAAQELVNLKLTPSKVLSKLLDDLEENSKEDIKFKLAPKSLANKEKVSEHYVDLIAYLLNRWSIQRSGSVNPKTLRNLFDDDVKVQSALENLCQKNIGTMDIHWTKCGKQPRLEISMKRGNLFAFCEAHDSPSQGARSSDDLCFMINPSTHTVSQDLSSSSVSQSETVRSTSRKRKQNETLISSSNKKFALDDDAQSDSEQQEAETRTTHTSGKKGSKSSVSTRTTKKTTKAKPLAIQMNSKPTLYQLVFLEPKKASDQPIRIIKRLTPHWKNFAVHMDFDARGIEIARIGAENPVDQGACCREVFTLWIGGKGRRPTTWKTLIKVMDESEENDLAEEVKLFIKK